MHSVLTIKNLSEPSKLQRLARMACSKFSYYASKEGNNKGADQTLIIKRYKRVGYNMDIM